MSQEQQPRLPHPKAHNQAQLFIHLRKPTDPSSIPAAQLSLQRGQRGVLALPPTPTPTADTLCTLLFGGSPDGIEPPW
jgi:hypothetical protein